MVKNPQKWSSATFIRIADIFDLAFCNELIAAEGKNLREQCQLISTLGFQGIELVPASLGIFPHQLPASEIGNIREAIAESGLLLTGLHWLLAGYPELSITDPEQRSETTEVLCSLVDLCAALGGKVLVHGSPDQRLINTNGYEEGARNASEIFKAVAENAGRNGLTYCIEPLSPDQTQFVNTVEQGAELAHRVNNPAFLTMIDTSSAHFSESNTVAETIREWLPGNMIGHLHFNDSNRGAPGTGNDPFFDIVKAVIDCGWSKTVTIEPFVLEVDAATTAEISISTIQGIQNQLAEA